MRDFRKLNVWKRSHRLTLVVYETTAGFPKTELYGLTSQIRRACLSVPANIAEGCGRNSKADFARFLHIAIGSASELDYCLLLAKDLGFITDSQYEPLAKEVSETRMMLAGLIQTLA